MKYLVAMVMALLVATAQAEETELEQAIYDYLYGDSSDLRTGYLLGSVTAIWDEAGTWINHQSICIPEGINAKETIKAGYAYIKDLRDSGDPEDIEFLESTGNLSDAYSMLKLGLLSRYGSVRSADCWRHEKYLEETNHLYD